MWFGGGHQPAATAKHQQQAGNMTGRPSDEHSRLANSETDSNQGPSPAFQIPTTINPPPCVQQQQQTPSTSTASLLIQSSSSSNQSSNSNQSSSPRPDNVSFHLKSSIFTRLVTIDSDKMALGLVKQLAIAFLNEIYFDHPYPSGTYIGDYLKRHFASNDNLQALYDRIILRIYSPEQDSFVPFYSVSDIQSDSYVSIEISERQPKHQQHLLAGGSTHLAGQTGGQYLANSSQNLGHHHQLPMSSSNYKLKISHDFHTATYIKPTYCSSCSTLIIGVYKQGFQCSHCRRNYCPKCKNKAEQSGEGCLAPTPAPMTPTTTTSPGFLGSSPGSSNISTSTTKQQPNPSSIDSGAPSSPSYMSFNSQLNSSNNIASSGHAVMPASNNSEKLEISSHANMSKRKSASNLLHFNLANPFKSHHQMPSGNATTSSHQANATTTTTTSHQSGKEETSSGSRGRAGSTSKSMRGSTGALDPILQQLSKQMRDQGRQDQQNKLAATAPAEQRKEQPIPQQNKNAPDKLLIVQPGQLSSSHQNLHTITSERDELHAAGYTSAHQSPSKAAIPHQLSNSARNSARDVSYGTSTPTRPREHHQASSHTFISMDWIQVYGEPNCGVCNKSLRGNSNSSGGGSNQAQACNNQPAAMCKTCKLKVHAHCQDLALADCLSRITEATRAAAGRIDSLGNPLAGTQSPAGADDTADEKPHLKSTNSNVSRENIRLHRLAPSVKHIKRPDLTKPIIEGWLQHKTLSDEQPRRHYWRLDETDITLYESDTSPRYFKAIAVSKITRVISASSLPKQIKEDVALGSPQRQQTKSANTSPSKMSSEFRAQMEAMFAFEVTTGSVYLVQANDQVEANRWRGSLEAITRAKLAVESQQQAAAKECEATAQQEVKSSGADHRENQTAALSKHTFKPQQAEVERTAAKERDQREKANEPHEHSAASLISSSLVTSDNSKKQGRHYHHHHHHHHGQQQQAGSSSSLSSSGYRGQHKTYTDPNRSRLYNRPRIVIKLDPMSIPDHWIEGRYLIERNRTKGVGFEELGSGQFGKVYAAISEIKAEDSTKGLWSGVPVAIKEISKARFDLRQQAKLKNEANILSRLDHPGVIILERVHDLPDKLYIVMEQLEDDMLEMIVSTEEKRLSERVTKFLTYQILEALKYLHSQNIAHCDLKPENVLLCEQRSQFPQIKLCDFGFAKIIEENSFRSSLVGTPAYLAPEVVKGERYNRSVDLWSVGVIVYVSLSGEFPFNEGENIHDQISRANFMYPDQPWAKISQQAKNFINSLLRVNSDKRLSASRAQMDTWIQDYQLWCDLCELELRVGRRWVTDDADFGRWSLYAKQHHLQVPRAAVQLHQELGGD